VVKETPKYWTIGQKVTLKNSKDCTEEHTGEPGFYYGVDGTSGKGGTIQEYSNFVEEEGCWSLRIFIPEERDWFYYLERDLVEYDQVHRAGKQQPVMRREKKIKIS